VVEAAAEVLRSRGCEVHLAAIEFIDPRYAKRFEVFPMPHPFLEHRARCVVLSAAVGSC
jgi:hypothetical protein